MKYVVYCDESRHNEDKINPYMSIGSLWLPRNIKDDMTKRFRHICFEKGLASEIKWAKVSRKKLDSYKKLADFFFAEADLRFRAIVIKQSDINYEKFHGSDRELGFYKFYYEMLLKWIEPRNEYLFLLDFKQNKYSHRYTDLLRILQNKIKGQAWISDLTVIDSKETPLAQLCDLLTGATAAAWCNNLQNTSPKKDLISYISEKRGSPLNVPSSSPMTEKINIFNINLKE